MMDKFLSQCVGGFEVNQEMMFIKDPPEFPRCSYNRGNEDVVTFSHFLLSVCSGSFRGSDKGPVWVATGFCLLPLRLSGHSLSPMV